MNPQLDILAELRDIVVPQTSGMWPPAIGWWLLAIGIIGIIVAGWWLTAMRPTRYQLRKQVRQQLLKIDALQTPEALIELSILMRRIAISCYPQQSVASLTGQKWLEFLDQSSNTTDFTEGPGRLIAVAPYAPSHTDDARAAIAVCRNWIYKII